MSKTFLFQVIQFSIITLFSPIWPIDRTLLGAYTPGQSGPRSDGNEGVVRISRNSSITRTSPSHCLVSYAGHSFVGGGSYLSAEEQSVCSTTLADWSSIPITSSYSNYAILIKIDTDIHLSICDEMHSNYEQLF